MMQKKRNASIFLVMLAIAGVGVSANASHLLVEGEGYDRDEKTILREVISGRSAAGSDLVQRGVNKGGKEIVVFDDETNPLTLRSPSPSIKLKQTTEEPSPFEQPNYWRALFVRSVVASSCSSAFLIEQAEVPVVGLLGLVGYAYYGGFSVALKVIGTGVGGVAGGIMGGGLARAVGDERIVMPFFLTGCAVGYGVSTVLVDSLSYGWKRLLGTTKTITHKTFEVQK